PRRAVPPTQQRCCQSRGLSRRFSAGSRSPGAELLSIAAPQVSQSDRLFIVASRPNLRYPHAPTMAPTAMINPRIIAHSPETIKDWEGCLCVPGIRGLVPRYQAIEVEYTDRDGQRHQQQLTDFIARIFQHEYDHLDGLIFLDRLETTRDIITEQEYLQRVLPKTSVG
ncbi:MAG: peptide deformylase, partial [Symploca sp. SIO1C4]|nr:peptide deformylase [Symploca sp. SIO1C4]